MVKRQLMIRLQILIRQPIKYGKRKSKEHNHFIKSRAQVMQASLLMMVLIMMKI